MRERLTRLRVRCRLDGFFALVLSVGRVLVIVYFGALCAVDSIATSVSVPSCVIKAELAYASNEFGLLESNRNALGRLYAQTNDIDLDVVLVMNFVSVLDDQSKEQAAIAKARIDGVRDYLAGVGIERNRIFPEYRQDRSAAKSLYLRYAATSSFDGHIGIAAIGPVKAVKDRNNPCPTGSLWQLPVWCPEFGPAHNSNSDNPCPNDNLVERPQSCLRGVCK